MTVPSDEVGESLVWAGQDAVHQACVLAPQRVLNLEFTGTLVSYF